uniref:PRI3a n=1 Tax=Cyclocybe aegerita TaxID=1973307 RepID=Q8TGA6_CYCAE|nr:PRI3a [Cyclocybe aegerita]
MRISTAFVTLTYVLATMVVALPPGPTSLEVEALEGRANDLQCLCGNVVGNFCDNQGCRDGGGYCQYNAQTKRCSMVNMRGNSAPVGCLSCTCIKA